MDAQLQIQGKTADPWLSCDNVTTPEISINKFEDNFHSHFFARLPDSEEYLAILERKLQKIKSNTDVLAQLAEKREACMHQLLVNGAALEQDQHIDFENSTTSLILKTIAPQKQALNQGELLELVKNDHLDSSDTNCSSNYLSTKPRQVLNPELNITSI